MTAAALQTGSGRLPGFGKEFREARTAGRYVNPWLFCGPRAFELAALRGPGRLVLPEGEDPARFDWSLVAGFDVVARWPGASLQEIDALGRLLMSAGARTVLALEDLKPDGSRFVSVRPPRRFITARRAAQ